MAHAELVRKMLIPTAVGSDAPRDCWATYIDAASGARYVYNAKTGESKWSGTAVEQIRLQMAGHEDAPPDAPEPPTRPLELELVNLKSFKAARPKAPKARDDDFDFEDLDGADDDPLQLATEWRDRGMLRTVSTRKRVPLACHERCCDRLVDRSVVQIKPGGDAAETERTVPRDGVFASRCESLCQTQRVAGLSRYPSSKGFG
ncbi:hypothetical protein M885DRAFT_4057 [Pelagophyceae sp. CCMP2097]|nr:hypothetical protein M885DRAFT_4057 [Pelagophyceae sp. CCMP2097]